MKKPNLFIVGQAKSGTSALHSFLDKHKDICMSFEKEPNFFSTDLHKESDKFHGKKVYFQIRKVKDYLKIFSDLDRKIVGEASTSYIYSSSAAENIHTFNKNGKILVVFREPVSFLYSLHSQYVSETTEDVKDFEEALSLEKDRRKGLRVPKRAWSPSIYFYRERIKYLEQIKRYVKLFDKKNIKVIVFEDFVKDNKKVYLEILDFLGVDSSGVDLSFKKVNPNKKVRFGFLYSIFRSPSVAGFSRKVLPAKVHVSLKKLVFKLFFKHEKRKPLSIEFRNKLMKEFKSEVVAFNKYVNKEGLVDKDLVKLWGYDKV